MKRFTIFDTEISIVKSYKDVFDKMVDFVFNVNRCSYLTLNNVHTVVESTLSKSYRNIINSSYLSLPDGQPLTVYAKIRYNLEVPRIFGPTLLETALEWGQHKQIKHYFFGSTEEELQQIKNNIAIKYPKAIIVGMFSPPFRNFTAEENVEFINSINQKKPDFIWVGLGAPKQECWIYNNYSMIDRGVLIAVGAGFSYLAGNTKHAPSWMKKKSLEWLYRLIQEPKRLWRRYLKYNSIFLFLVICEIFRIKIYKVNKR